MRKSISYRQAAPKCLEHVIERQLKSFAKTAFAVFLGYSLLGHSTEASAQISIIPADEIVLDPNALVLATGGNFSRTINGSPFQQDVLLTHEGYQYATWYHNGPEQDIYIARRNLNGTTWETFDTGYDLENGDESASSAGRRWDSHNIISMGISGDGRIHLSFDHHVDQLRYVTTAPGVASNSGGTWNASIFQDERNRLNPGGAVIPRVTYPRFANVGDDLVLTFRDRGSGNGDVLIANYDAQSGLWSNTSFVNEGQLGSGTYDDANNNPSTRRNAYHNGFHADSTGRLHTTWTWRERTQDGNHDINYAYSDDKGVTWRNTNGELVGTNSSPINVNSDVEVVDLDRRQGILNQQGQIVDAEGGVHALMFHRLQGVTYTNSPFSDRNNSAYHHYYRDPNTGDWDVSLLPQDEPVGSRPRIAVDAHGNLFGAYTSGDNLIIAGAEKTENGFADWEILHKDSSRDYEGTPTIDLNRLSENGVLSIYLQEEPTTSSETDPTGTPLRVLEFNTLTSLTTFNWTGSESSFWLAGGPDNWDISGDSQGDVAYANGRHVVFNDNATQFAVNMLRDISPGSVTFSNNANDYLLFGVPISGSGDLRVTGSGRVTLANGANTYSGDTIVENGTLEISSGTTIAGSPTIRIESNGVLVATDTLSLSNQTIEVAGQINGNVEVASNSVFTGTGLVDGNVIAHDAIVRVGSAGVLTASGPLTTLIDDFSSNSLSDYTETRVLDSGTVKNASFVSSGGSLQSISVGADGPEQTLLLRSDYGLEVGQELQVDANIVATNDRDLGIIVAADDMPAERSRSDYVYVALTESANRVKVRGFDGTTPLNLTTDNSAADKETLFVARLDENTFELGYYIGSQRSVVSTQVFSNTDIGSAIGFYSDRRADGTINGLDNLRIFDPNHTQAFGETLTIDGNLTLNSLSTLELGIFSPAESDQLIVMGVLQAAGSLDVSIDPSAEALQDGDVFAILDVNTLTGVFDDSNLPLLSQGLIWDTSRLGTEGLLEVAAGISGDFNSDGSVDAADFVVWRNSLDSTGFGLAADANNDFRVDIDDYNVWVASYGLQSNQPLVAQVPEPSSLLLALISTLALFRKSRC